MKDFYLNKAFFKRFDGASNTRISIFPPLSLLHLWQMRQLSHLLPHGRLRIFSNQHVYHVGQKPAGQQTLQQVGTKAFDSFPYKCNIATYSKKH